jgi:hypothetical protein
MSATITGIDKLWFEDEWRSAKNAPTSAKFFHPIVNQVQNRESQVQN